MKTLLIRKSAMSWDILVPMLERHSDGVDPRGDAMRIQACLRDARLSTSENLEPDPAMPDHYVVTVRDEGIGKNIRGAIEAAVKAQFADEINLFPSMPNKSGR